LVLVVNQRALSWWIRLKEKCIQRRSSYQAAPRVNKVDWFQFAPEPVNLRMRGFTTT
jgi:hypothetical protein